MSVPVEYEAAYSENEGCHTAPPEIGTSNYGIVAYVINHFPVLKVFKPLVHLLVIIYDYHRDYSKFTVLFSDGECSYPACDVSSTAGDADAIDESLPPTNVLPPITAITTEPTLTIDATQSLTTGRNAVDVNTGASVPTNSFMPTAVADAAAPVTSKRTPAAPVDEGTREDDGEAAVYVWGSNSSHQLAEGSQDKVIRPKINKAFGKVKQVG